MTLHKAMRLTSRAYFSFALFSVVLHIRSRQISVAVFHTVVFPAATNVQPVCHARCRYKAKIQKPSCLAQELLCVQRILFFNVNAKSLFAVILSVVSNPIFCERCSENITCHERIPLSDRKLFLTFQTNYDII